MRPEPRDRFKQFYKIYELNMIKDTWTHQFKTKIEHEIVIAKCLKNYLLTDFTNYIDTIFSIKTCFCLLHTN